MAVWNGGAQALPTWSSAPPTGHVGGGPCLVDKDEASRIEFELAFKPGLPPFQDVGAKLARGHAKRSLAGWAAEGALLGSMRRLFSR